MASSASSIKYRSFLVVCGMCPRDDVGCSKRTARCLDVIVIILFTIALGPIGFIIGWLAGFATDLKVHALEAELSDIQARTDKKRSQIT